jgi:hypothetical protein
LKQQHEYYIHEIRDLKEYINNIEIYESPQNKPVYNVDNAFTAALIDFFCRKDTVSHIVLMTSVKRVL